MRKGFRSGAIILLTLLLTACGQNAAEKTDMTASVEVMQAAVIETAPTDESMESIEGSAVKDREESEPSAEGKIIMKAEFDFETRAVMLNSGYEMPINGLGTYSLHGDECIGSVKCALSNGVRLIDTASAYGNDVICCEL